MSETPRVKVQSVSAARVWGSGGQHTAQSHGVEEQDGEPTGRSNMKEQARGKPEEISPQSVKWKNQEGTQRLENHIKYRTTTLLHIAPYRHPSSPTPNRKLKAKAPAPPFSGTSSESRVRVRAGFELRILPLSVSKVTEITDTRLALTFLTSL